MTLVAVDQALAALDALFARQCEALRTGDADAVASTAMLMREPLAVLARHASGGRPLPATWRARLHGLAAQAEAARTMLARRSVHVDRALDALGASARLQERQLQGTYGARGGLASGFASRGTFAAA